MRWLDKLSENSARRLARHSSRRGFISKLGLALVGGAVIPLLPVARAHEGGGAEGDPQDPNSCSYWRYCGIDGFLCSCCGGDEKTCPPGTELSPITWVGTCRNPADDKDYIISYNDCCGKSSCGRCFCNRNVGARPTYQPFLDNDLNWCLGTGSNTYHCSTAIVLGLSKK